jgi:anti-anti-sigma factor
MSNLEIIKMPKRFDYGASSAFNASFSAVLPKEKKVGAVILLDCAQMEYIDSSGIGLLVMSYKKAEAVGAKISLINTRTAAKEILHLANLQKIIEIK